MNLMEGMLVGWVGAALFMVLLWAWQLRSGNAGIVDFGWALSIGALAIFAAASGDAPATRKILVGATGSIWGFRLALHLLRDRILGKEEEGRYVHLREHWKGRESRAFFWFFQAQALLAAILALPFFLAARNAAPVPDPFAIAGAILWLVGIAGESIADHQLARFKADPANRGRTCREGLWRYSRHPNYFFEWVIWVGMATIALGAPWGWLGLLSPALILYFVLFVTGIPPTEKQALRSRGEDYRRYQRQTSAFFPWFPKESS